MMITRTLGGMTGARLAPPRIIPIDRRRSYPRAIMPGKIVRAIMAATAMFDPESAPKIADRMPARTYCRPFTRPMNRSTASKISSVAPDRNNISPMSTKSGIAVSCPFVVVANIELISIGKACGPSSRATPRRFDEEEGEKDRDARHEKTEDERRRGDQGHGGLDHAPAPARAPSGPMRPSRRNCSADSASPPDHPCRDPRLRIGTAAIMRTPLSSWRRLSSHAIHARPPQIAAPRSDIRTEAPACRRAGRRSSSTVPHRDVTAVARKPGQGREGRDQKGKYETNSADHRVGALQGVAQDDLEIVGQKDRREGGHADPEARLGHKIETAHRPMGPAPTGMPVRAGAGHSVRPAASATSRSPVAAFAAAVRREAPDAGDERGLDLLGHLGAQKSRPRRPMRRDAQSSSA